jgi:hypothetical protein
LFATGGHELGKLANKPAISPGILYSAGSFVADSYSFASYHETSASTYAVGETCFNSNGGSMPFCSFHAFRAKAFGVLRQVMNRHDGVVVRLCFLAANHKDVGLELRVAIGMGRVATCVLALDLLDRTSHFGVHRIHGGPQI